MLEPKPDAILRAMIDCPHEIEHDFVTLKYDPKKPGHNALAQLSARIRSALEAETGGGEPVADAGAMTAEEIRLEDLKQIAAYDGPIVSFEVREPYYLASCDKCGWVGSSEHCGTDSFGDDSDVYCPRCHASGADCGKIATALATPPATPPDERAVEALLKVQEFAQKQCDATLSDGSIGTGFRRAMLDVVAFCDGAALAAQEQGR